MATWAFTVLVAILALNFLTAQTDIQAPVVNVTQHTLDLFKGKAVDDYRRPREYTVYEVGVIYLNIDADFRPVWHWNVKHIFVYICATYRTNSNRVNDVTLWDRILLTKDDAEFHLQSQSEYPLREAIGDLKGQQVELRVQWQIVPIAGIIRDFSMPLFNISLPAEYTN